MGEDKSWKAPLGERQGSRELPFGSHTPNPVEQMDAFAKVQKTAETIAKTDKLEAAATEAKEAAKASEERARKSDLALVEEKMGGRLDKIENAIVASSPKTVASGAKSFLEDFKAFKELGGGETSKFGDFVTVLKYAQEQNPSKSIAALIKEAEGTIEPIIKESKDFPINVAEDPIKSNSVELLYKCLELGFNPKVVPGKNTEKKMNTMLNMFYRGPEHLEKWVTTEHNSSYLKHLWLNKKEVAPGPIIETIVEEVKENNFEIDLDGCEFGFKMTSRDLEAASFIQGQLEDICGVTKDNFAKLYDKCGMEDVFLGLEEFCVGATIEQIQAFVKSL